MQMASFEAKVLGRVRKLTEGIDAESPGNEEVQFALNQQLEQVVANGSAPYSEIVKVGRAFWTGTTSAIASVQAIPTTAVLFALYNNAPDGGRSLVIDWMAAQNVASTAVANQAQMLALVGQVREAAPTDAALTIKKCNGYGQAGPDTVVRSILNATALPTTTGVAANWFPVGPNGVKTGVTALPGYGMYQALDGRFIVPPGRYFAMHVISSVVGETFQGFIGWHEKQLLLG
jgi:hypothetical protein